MLDEESIRLILNKNILKESILLRIRYSTINNRSTNNKENEKNIIL